MSEHYISKSTRLTIVQTQVCWCITSYVIGFTRPMTPLNILNYTDNNEIIRVFHSLYKVGRNGNFVFKGFNNSKKRYLQWGSMWCKRLLLV